MRGRSVLPRARPTNPRITTIFVLGYVMCWFDSTSIIYAALAVGLCLASKTATCRTINTGVYRQPFYKSVLSQIPHELLVVPVAFGLGLFRRSIMWNGRRYRLGSKGRIVRNENLA